MLFIIRRHSVEDADIAGIGNEFSFRVAAK